MYTCTYDKLECPLTFISSGPVQPRSASTWAA